MALTRMALKNLTQRVVCPSSSSSSSSFLCQSTTEKALGSVQKQRWTSELLKRVSTAAGDDEEKPEGREVAVSEPERGKRFKLFPRKKCRRGLWRKNDRDFAPALWEFFPSGLGNALMQATENMNKLFDSLAPSQLLGRFKKKDDHYKLRFEVPGVSKEDLKITVEDGILQIEAEHKEEDEGSSSDDDESWWSSIYGDYHTSLLLPDDAKVDEIKAELKDGVLYVIIPRTENPKKDVKEIPVL
ncbi:unnamed protein product [Ilex paraguariensis]|uniref:SHSP domain-containing protein n=1 Tax=Ilex paraguariensis TaxID=185542 RepID=A0ABC8S4F9_9AQUA